MLNIILQSLETQHSTSFGHEDVRCWPKSALGILLEAGILSESGFARSVICRECPDECSVEVYLGHRDNEEVPSAFIECPHRDDIRRIQLPLDDLRTYSISLSGLAEWVAVELGTGDSARELLADRLWSLGMLKAEGAIVDVFLARGVSWTDAPTCFTDAPKHMIPGSSIVLVPNELPINYPFGYDIKALSLSSIASLDPDGIVLDLSRIRAVMADTRPKRTQVVPSFQTPPGATWDQVIIEVVSELAAKITVGMKTEHKTFDEMGFRDRRKPNPTPDFTWELLKLFAKNDGRLTWDDDPIIDYKPVTKKHVSDLRKRLRSFFRIEGDPFKPYRKERAYETNFIILGSRQPDW